MQVKGVDLRTMAPFYLDTENGLREEFSRDIN